MKASVKRIIWAIGWYAVWLFNDFLLVLRGKNPDTLFYELVMFAIWLIPLLSFKDDEEKGK